MSRSGNGSNCKHGSLTGNNELLIAGAGTTMNSQPIGFLLRAFLLLAAAGQSAAAQNGTACGNPFQNHFGPFDYREVDAQQKALFESDHFTPGVEALLRPATTTFTNMAADVAYTLHVFPNHHRALRTMARAAEKFKSDPAPGARYTVSCYFERAILFRPDDTVSRLLYAQYLSKANRKNEALAQVQQALQSAGDNPLTHYNVGLMALELGDVDLAVKQAREAKALGYTATALEDRLRAQGKWPTAAVDPAASAGSNVKADVDRQ